MPRQTPEARIAQARLILAADAEVSDAANHKLPEWLRTMLDTTLSDLENKHQAVSALEGARRADSTQVRRAYEEGEDLLREVNS